MERSKEPWPDVGAEGGKEGNVKTLGEQQDGGVGYDFEFWQEVRYSVFKVVPKDCQAM
jgi:hypothetical protein